MEGAKAVGEALGSPYPLECLICNRKGLDIAEGYADLLRSRELPCFLVGDEVMNYLTTTVTPQGVMVVAPFIHLELEEFVSRVGGTVVMTDRVRDPGNLGNIVRAADAAGAGGVVVCRESTDIYNPKTVRSTAGSLFHLPLCVGVELPAAARRLKEAGYGLVVADPRRGREMWSVNWPERTVLVLGNESWGIPEEDALEADDMVRIPILGKAESLNVSAAAAVLLYEIARTKGAGDG